MQVKVPSDDVVAEDIVPTLASVWLRDTAWQSRAAEATIPPYSG